MTNLLYAPCISHCKDRVRPWAFLNSNRVFSGSDSYTSEAVMHWEGLDKHPNDFLNHLNLSSLRNWTGRFSDYNLICKVCIISASSYKFCSHFLIHKISSWSHWNDFEAQTWSPIGSSNKWYLNIFFYILEVSGGLFRLCKAVLL